MDAEIVTLLAAIATSSVVIIFTNREKRSSLIKAAEKDDIPKFKKLLDGKKAAKLAVKIERQFHTELFSEFDDRNKQTVIDILSKPFE